MESLYRYFVDALRGSDEAFVQTHAGLYLLRAPSEDGELPDENITSDEFGAAPRRLPGNELQTGAFEEASPMLSQWTVAALKKRPGFPPFNRIAIGRWTSCDVVLPFSSVSALHAYVHIVESAISGISDRRSSHGTFVNDVRVLDGEIRDIGIGDRLRLGSVELELVDAAGFLARLKALL